MANSIRDIATTLNLSKTTISWILSGKGEAKGFSQATIERVKKFAADSNFQPNLLARSLSTGKSKMIGLIIPAIKDTFYAEMTQAVGLEANKNNYQLTVCYSDGDGERECQLIRQLRAKQFDGLIIAPSKKAKEGISDLIRDSYPFVLIDRFFPELNTNYIIVNNEESSFRLVTHLISQGRKRIAIITTDTDLLAIKQRIDGYKKALNNSNIPIDKQQLIKVARKDYTIDIVKVLDQFFLDKPDVDGFYFTTHYLALEAIRYFLKNNIDYSKFGLVCFHEMPALDILAPNMSIARMPIETMGQEAVRILVNAINNIEINQQAIVMNTNLFIND